MMDQAKLTQASRLALARNLRVLQGYRLAPNDHDHVHRLLDLMDPDENTTWLDIGSGFGEPARIMHRLRPDLKFWLVNNNLYQIEFGVAEMPTFFADMYELPFPDETADGAMFLFSLCHADNKVLALREAARVVRPGGALFVFDYARTGGDNRLAMRYLSSMFITIPQLCTAAAGSGWSPPEFMSPDGDDAVFRSVFEDEELYYEIFKDLAPVVWKAVRT